jgi:hypothetical protein
MEFFAHRKENSYMSILISSEVEQNRLLSKSEPGVYRLQPTFLVACSVCDNNFLEIFRKDKDFTKFSCENCW